MNISKISPVNFCGTLRTPGTKEWQEFVAGDKNFSKALSNLDSFVSEKLDPSVTVSLGFDAHKKVTSVRVQNAVSNGKENLVAAYSQLGFLENSGSSLQNRLKEFNA